MKKSIVNVFSAVCVMSFFCCCSSDKVQSPLALQAEKYFNENIKTLEIPSVEAVKTKSNISDIELIWNESLLVFKDGKTVIEVPIRTYPPRVACIVEGNGNKKLKRYATICSFLEMEYIEGKEEPEVFVATLVERGVRTAKSFANVSKKSDYFTVISDVSGKVFGNEFNYDGKKETKKPGLININQDLSGIRYYGYKISYEHLTKFNPSPGEYNPEALIGEVTCPHCSRKFNGDRNNGICPYCGCDVFLGFTYCVICGNSIEHCTCQEKPEICEQCGNLIEFCTCFDEEEPQTICRDCGQRTCNCVEDCSHENHECICPKPE